MATEGAITSPLDSMFSGTNLAALMQAMGGLFGQQGNTSGNVNTLQSTSNLSQGGQAGTTTGSTISPLALQSLQQLLPQLLQSAQQGRTDFSKEAAIRDSQGGVQEILRTLKEQALPGVFSSEAASGGYNSTVRQQLSNDLAARAAGQAQSLVSGQIKNYADIQSQQQNSLAQAINAATNAQRDVTGATSGTNYSSGSTQSATNQATIGQTNAQGLIGNSGVQTTAGILAAIYGLSGIAGVPGLSGLLGQLGSALGIGTGGPNLYGSIFPAIPADMPLPPDLGGGAEELGGWVGIPQTPEYPIEEIPFDFFGP